MRLSSESGSGSGTQTPSPEVEVIIKDLLSGRLDQAALGFQTVYRGPGGMGPPRCDAPPLPLLKEATPAEMILPSALEHATQLLASKDCSSEQEGRNNAEKVKFSTFKNAGHAAGDTPQ